MRETILQNMTGDEDQNGDIGIDKDTITIVAIQTTNRDVSIKGVSVGTWTKNTVGDRIGIKLFHSQSNEN